MAKLRKIIYIILNIFMLVSAVFSLWIYLSHNEWVSWYENSGIQFLALLIITLPILVVISIAFKILSKKYNMTKENVRLPLYIIIGIIFPVVIDGRLSEITIFIGTICCCIAIVKVIIDFIQNLSINKA